MAKEKDSLIQILGFTLNQEEYALEINNVQEIIKPAKSTRVPRAKKYIVGVINLRGIVLPIIDLNLRFNLEKAEKADKQRIIILKIDTVTVGIVVDSVSEVMEISATQIYSNPTIDSSINQEYLKGVCKLDDERLFTLLNIEKTLEIKG